MHEVILELLAPKERKDGEDSVELLETLDP